MLFFVISGFCIHLANASPKDAPGRPFEALAFIWRRFWRIVPPYFISLGLSYFLGYTDPLSIPALRHLALHCTLLHTLFPGHFYAINWVHWSVAVEWQLYLLYPLLQLIRNKFNYQWVLIMTFSVALAIRLSPQDSGYHSTLTVLPMKWWGEWILGAWIAERLIHGKKLLPTGRWVPLLIWAAIGLCYWAKLWDCYYYLLILAFGVAVQNAATSTSRPGKTSQALAFVGRCSFSIYLFHVSILGLCVPLFPFVGIDPKSLMGWAISGAILLIPTLIVSHLSYRFVELPSISLGKVLWKKFHKQEKVGRTD